MSHAPSHSDAAYGTHSASDEGRCSVDTSSLPQLPPKTLREEEQEKILTFSGEASKDHEYEGNTPVGTKDGHTQVEEDVQDPQPPDGGWGWVVAMGAFTVSVS